MPGIRCDIPMTVDYSWPAGPPPGPPLAGGRLGEGSLRRGRDQCALVLYQRPEIPHRLAAGRTARAFRPVRSTGQRPTFPRRAPCWCRKKLLRHRCFWVGRRSQAAQRPPGRALPPDQVRGRLSSHSRKPAGGLSRGDRRVGGHRIGPLVLAARSPAMGIDWLKPNLLDRPAGVTILTYREVDMGDP